MPEPESDERKSAPSRLGLFGSVTALVLVAIYISFVALQWGKTGVDAIAWARRQELLKGLEALAFTGLGALLGTTVQRQVTKKAEDLAQQAQNEANRNARDAEKGRALQHAIEARREVASSGRERDVARGAPSGASATEALAELSALARQYDDSA
jgi:hypothetical protein